MTLFQEQSIVRLPKTRKYILWDIIILLAIYITLFLAELTTNGLNKFFLSVSQDSFFKILNVEILLNSISIWIIVVIFPSILFYLSQIYFDLRIGKKIFFKLISYSIIFSVLDVILVCSISFLTGERVSIFYIPIFFFYILIGYVFLSVISSLLIYNSESKEKLRETLAKFGRNSYLIGYLSILLVIGFNSFLIFGWQKCISLGGPDWQALCYADHALGKNNPNECQKAIKKDLCLRYLSFNIDPKKIPENELSFCNRINNEGHRIQCLIDLKYFENNPTEEDCFKLNSELTMNYCLYTRAGKKKFANQALCEKISDAPMPHDFDTPFVLFQENTFKEACLNGVRNANWYK